jgi:hypothetical protein
MAEEQLDSILGRIGSQPLEKQPGLLREEQAKLIPKISEAQYGETGTKRAELETEIATKEAGVLKGQEISGLAEADILEKQTEIKKHGIPTFKPTQEDLGSYAQLGSMVATLGLMLGNGGKESSRMAIGSMTGMLNGWRQGRKDLYEKESKAFDYEVKRIDSIRKDLQNDLNMAQKLWATKRTEAMTIAELAARKAGTNSILSAYIRRGDLNGAQQMLASSEKTALEAIKEKEKFEIRKETTDYRNRQLSLSEARNRIAQNRAAAGGDKDDRAKATTPDVREYRALDTQERLWGRMKEKLSDENFRKRFDDLGIKKLFFEPLAGDGVMSLVSKSMSAKLAEATAKKDPEILGLLQDILQVRNAYYLVQSGKAVTGGEAARNFFVTAQPTDAASVLVSKIDRAIKDVAEEKTAMETAYRNITPRTNPAQTPSVKKPMPTGEKLSAYAKENFEGDENLAKKYLNSQGYK